MAILGTTEMSLDINNSLSKESQNLANVSSSVEDLFTLLESSGKTSVVQEVKQLINEQYSEGKRSVWLGKIWGGGS